MGESRNREVAWLIIATGFVMTFAVALIPQATGAFLLSGTHLMVGILPYVIYGVLVALRATTPIILLGVVLLILHFLCWQLGWFYPQTLRPEIAVIILSSGLSAMILAVGWLLNPRLSSEA